MNKVNNWFTSIYLYKILVLIVFVVLVTLVSCKKNSAPVPSEETNRCNCPNEGECYNFEKTDRPTFGWTYINDSAQNVRPCFNPKNSSEIVFVKQGQLSEQLVKYNMATKEKKILYTGRVFFQPKWSSTGWIIFSGTGNQIWKIKDDGSNLTQLTFKDRNFYPEWAPDGKRFCYGKIIDTVLNGRNTALGVGIIADENGYTISEMDYTQNLGIGIISFWDKSNTILGGSINNSILFYNPDSKQTRSYNLNFCDDIYSLYCTSAKDSNQFFLSSKGGIFNFNTHTNSYSCIAKNCDSRTYIFFSYSELSNKIIVDCAHNTPNYDKGEIYQKNVLYLMNEDGSDKQLIDIPN